MFWGYGLYFGGVDVGMSFLINGSGQFALRESRGNTNFYNKAGEFEFSPHIQQGNVSNFLKVQYNGDHVILWANGKQLESISKLMCYLFKLKVLVLITQTLKL